MGRERDGFRVLFAGDTRRDPEFLAELGKVETEFASEIAALIVVPGMTHERRLLLAYGIVGISETTCRHCIDADLDVPTAELAQAVADLAWAGLRGLRAD